MKILQSMSHIQVYGIVLLIFGFLVRYIIGRRKFNRRGLAGLQEFKSYGWAVIVTAMETILNWIGNFCILFAIFLLLLDWYTVLSA